MYRNIALTLFCTSVLLSSLVNATTPSYATLEEFCLATKADTAENCACGQAKADELLTPEEQQLVIGMMTQDPNAMSQIMQSDDQGQSLMEKVDQITKGCD
ncbi:MAG: hypothetical protein KTR32_01385 [Granulosicoccus sp.]|nr:hypothetical protein [Granulosicoccus sp.]